MNQNNNKPVSPIYAIIALWILWTVILPLATLLQYVPLVIMAILVYNSVSKIQAQKSAKKAKEPEKKAPPAPAPEPKSDIDPQVARLIKQRDTAVGEMRRLNINIENEKISRQINDLEYTSSKIFDHVIAHPDKVGQISKFLNYYLPTTLKLLNTYDRMNSQGVDGENINSTMKKVDETLDMVVQAFHKQLDTLFAGEALDVSSDITVMENLMKNEGLAGSDFETSAFSAQAAESAVDKQI